MDETILKIAIAAFIHDLGMFVDKGVIGTIDQGINELTDSCAEKNAAFLNGLKEYLPSEFKKLDWGIGDPLIDLVTGHFKPVTPMQWVIALADHVSSGQDTKRFGTDENRRVKHDSSLDTRLLPIFEQLMADEVDESNNIEKLSYCYPLEALSPKNIFPGLRSDFEPKSAEEASDQYRKLFGAFIEDLKHLKSRESVELWFENFESLMGRYTTSVPVLFASDAVPDVSLYDHSKITSAIAAAIYAFHEQTKTLTPEAIKNDADNKFLIINGDFHGIQNFIFRVNGDTQKYRSKLLRGRSFAVSLLSELASDMLCREFGLPHTATILNTAGKFTVLAPNVPDAEKIVKSAENNINKWLIKVSYGETVIGLSYSPASCRDFVSDNFSRLWRKMNDKKDEKKYSAFDLNCHGGVVKKYLESFNTDLADALCPICHKRPSSEYAENSQYVKEAKSSCGLCRDHVFLGTNLVKQNRLAVFKGSFKDMKKKDVLLTPIFDTYQLAFFEKSEENELFQGLKKGDLLKYWDLSLNPEGDVAIKHINGFVPRYGPEDLEDERILSSLKTDQEKQDFQDQVKAGTPKSLNHIACKAINLTEKKDKFLGIDILGVLKADVDDLGLLMACGLSAQRFTLSRIITLSRHLHYYFTVYLPEILHASKAFNNVYTVFAGGDDLFLIGPWNRIIELSLVLEKSFSEYVCHNKKVHFSAGISFHKPHTPINTMAEAAESELEKAKSSSKEKNRLTLFSETATWAQVKNLMEVKKVIEAWLNDGRINKAMLYRLNELMQMAHQERQIISEKEIHINELSCTKWRFLLAYTVERNVAKQLKGNEEERKKQVKEAITSITQWLSEYEGKLKIPIWDILYNSR